VREDVLEQLVDDYLQAKGYFTRHNLKFRPRRDHVEFQTHLDSNHSDIDVVGVDPRAKRAERVWVVSCKSWQAGFDVRAKLEEIEKNKRRGGRESWQYFRELAKPKWSEAFVDAVEAVTGSRSFTYITAVTKLRGDRALWEGNERLKAAMGGNPIRLITLEEMLRSSREAFPPA